MVESKMSKKQLQNEVHYIAYKEMLASLQKMNILTKEEVAKLDKLNRKHFNISLVNTSL